MNKVVTINLGGNAYQLEELAYDALRAYIKSAETALADNPDKDEIVKDLELAIATKVTNYLSANKTVVTLEDIEGVLKEMGPVEGAGGTESEQTHRESSPAPKRLFRLPESGIIFGVCSGVAAYLNIDVTLVRILVVLLTFFTGGGVILVYVVLAICIPKANSPKERAQAFGEMPVTAQELVNRATEGYKNFKDSDEWKNWKEELREQSKHWRQQWKEHKHKERALKRQLHQQYRAEYQYKHHHSPVSEIFGIAVATLALTFLGWFLYHHVPLMHDFFSAIHQAWNSFMYQLAQVIDN
jgi:phage shock protein PspC (stress-responsive transcriptional regulator)